MAAEGCLCWSKFRAMLKGNTRTNTARPISYESLFHSRHILLDWLMSMFFPWRVFCFLTLFGLAICKDLLARYASRTCHVSRSAEVRPAQIAAWT